MSDKKGYLHKEKTRKLCKYCDKETEFFECISQVPDSVCPVKFITENLLAHNGESLYQNDFICTEHEPCFQLKYKSSLRDIPFQKKYKSSINICNSACAKCQKLTSHHYLISNSGLEFVEFLVNGQLSTSSRTTRTGTGIGEGNVLCSHCYFHLRLLYSYQKHGKSYCPQRGRPKSSTTHESNDDLLDTDTLCHSKTEVCSKVDCNVKSDASRYTDRDYEHLQLDSKSVQNVLELLKQYDQIKCVNNDGTFLHRRCYMALYSIVKKHRKCPKCKKPLHKSPSSGTSAATILLTNDILNKVKEFRKMEEDEMTEQELINIEKIHSQCSQDISHLEIDDKYKIHEEHAPSPNDEVYDQVYEANTLEELDLSHNAELNDNFDDEIIQDGKEKGTETLKIYFESFIKKLENQEPILITNAFDDFLNLLYMEAEKHDMHILEHDLSYSLFTHKLNDIIDKSGDKIRKYKLSNKQGSMVYMTDWNMLDVLYKTVLKMNNLESNIPTASVNESFCVEKTPYVTASDMMHCAQEIRRHIERGIKYCDIYARYPQLLQSLTLENILVGHYVTLDDDTRVQIPGLDPLLINFYFYLICSDEERQRFETCFPTWDYLYTEGYNDKTVNIFRRAVCLVVNLYYNQNNDNCYPIPMMLCDLIENSSPTELMTSLNAAGICPTRQTYLNFKKNIATMNKNMKEKGVIIGYDYSLMGVIHLDNLEQYQKFARNPSTALSHSLVIAVQQPTHTNMVHPGEQFSTDTVITPVTKRPASKYQPSNTHVPAYTTPRNCTYETRQCKITDFTCDSEEDVETIDNFKIEVLTHALERLLGNNDGKQCVPSIKDVMRYTADKISQTKTVYIELIPEKPDCKETILFALTKVEHLFIRMLHYTYVVVCGDGLTCNLLYQIKDEYGDVMQWLLPMLGTWHTLKDYLFIFMKKYKYAFVKTLLKECLSENTVKSIINVNNWSKSHNYASFVMEALLRLYMEAFINTNRPECAHLIESIQRGIQVLSSAIDISTEDVSSNFGQIHKECCSMMKELLVLIKEYNIKGCTNDRMFHLFHRAIEDWMVYLSVYISIRKGKDSWDMRNVGLKCMAERFVVSGATMYQYLILRHLADLHTVFPEYIIEFYKAGGWVSAYRDGKMNALARDEYHERTASKDIQLVMPRTPTDSNMEVVCHYLCPGASMRSTLLREILGINAKVNKPKGLSVSFIEEQERNISKILTKLRSIEPFSQSERPLVKPFTKQNAAANIENDLLKSDEIGKKYLLAYISTRYCAREHAVISEKSRMKRKVLSTFIEKAHKSKKKDQLKEQIELMQVITSSAVKLAEGDNVANKEKVRSIIGSQLTSLPELFCEKNGDVYRKDVKTGVLKFVEAKYAGAFSDSYDIDKTSLTIRDSMQDIMLTPMGKTLDEYFELFWRVCVLYSFKLTNDVCLVFDRQSRGPSPKDCCRKNRDEKNKNRDEKEPCPDFELNGDVGNIIIPKSKDYRWAEVLANRNNKKVVVGHLVCRLKSSSDRISAGKQLVLLAEGQAWQVTPESCTPLDRLNNNHEEADTLMFSTVALTNYPQYLLISTDSDIPFISCLNYSKLKDKKIIIKNNVSGSPLKYIDCSKLHDLMNIDQDGTLSLLKTRKNSIGTPIVFGLLHYIAGSDYMSFLRSITQNDCCRAMMSRGDFIFPEEMTEDIIFSGEKNDLQRFLMIRFLSAVYRSKYGVCFSKSDKFAEIMSGSDDANAYKSLLTYTRNITWHATVIKSNVLPSIESISLRAWRFAYVLSFLGNANVPIHKTLDMEEYGYIIVDGVAKQIWDTETNMLHSSALIKEALTKCGCKSGCSTKRCICVRGEGYCSHLCICSHCENNEENNENAPTENNDENKNESDTESATESENETDTESESETESECERSSDSDSEQEPV